MAEIGKAEDETAHGVTVFVSDPSAEAERLAQALRAAGYAVVDVPLSFLLPRVAVQRPRVIVVDGDAEGAMEATARVRELSENETIDIIYLGKAGELRSPEHQAALAVASGYFTRPCDIAALVRKVDSLTGGPKRLPPRPTTPPPSLPASRPPSRPPSGHPSLPPASMRSPDLRGVRNTPPPRTALGGYLGAIDPSQPRKTPSAQAAPLSNELEALLVEAEQRIGGQLAHESMLPTPEEEIEAVLPAEVLASLDDPLEEDDEDLLPFEPAFAAHHRGNTTGSGKLATGAGTGAGTGNGTPQPAQTSAARAMASEASLPGVPKTHGGTNAGSLAGGTTGLGRAVSGREGSEPQVRETPAEPRSAPAVLQVAPSTSSVPNTTGVERASAVALTPPAPSMPEIPSVLGPGEAARALANAIAGRGTGVLAFDARDGLRRVVLREGDVVTAASAIDDESLLPFLAARGELPRDRVAQLSGKVPPFGRHAGAALVAHGYLRQDQLWSVLRAHAEWVIGRVVAIDSGTARFEDDPPGRLRSEPSVFGGSTGAEVFVEVVRRGVAPKEAMARLGGEGSRIADGGNARLALECALGAAETAWLGKARGKSIGEAMASAGDPDFAAVLYSLVLLGVCEAIRAVGAPARPAIPSSPPVDPLDEEAIRARVMARMQLVDEGDYFAVLGVARDATSYEVKRAFLELRRTFEPSKLLTPGLADLSDDVRKIASVLDEAYEILKDSGRRDRYRRAIDAVPR